MAIIKNKILIFYIFIFIILYSTVFINIFTSIPSPNFEDSCNTSINFAKTYFDESQNIVKIIENDDLTLIKNFKNIKCLGKVSFVNNAYGIIFLNTSLNIYFEYFLFFLLFFVIVNNRKNKYLISFSSVTYFIIFFTVYAYRLNIFYFLIISLYLLALVLYQYNKKYSYLILFYLAYFSFNNLNEIKLTGNEVSYIGKLFKSSSEYSSFISSANNFSSFFEMFINTFIKIFNTNFYLLLNIFIGASFCFLIFKLLSFFQIKNIYSLAFLLFLNNYQSVMGNTAYYEGGIEPNTFGNLLLTASFYSLLNNKKYLSIVLYTLAAYFHLALAVLLVPLFIFLNYKFTEKFIIYDIKQLFLVFSLNLPFLYWILINQLNYKNNFYNYEQNKYFIATRAPHHLYPFLKEQGKVLSFNPDFGWREGFINLFLIYMLCLSINYFKKSYSNTKLFEIVSFLFFTIIIYTLIVFYFPYSDFVILHPFKISSYFIVFSLLYIINFLNNYLNFLVYKFESLQSVLFLFLVLFIFVNSPFSLNKNFDIRENKLELIADKKQTVYNFEDIESIVIEKENLELLEKLKIYKPDVILFPEDISKNHNFLYLIEAYSGIPTYVSFKNSPIISNDFQEWEKRILNKEAFYSGACNSIENVKNIIYLVSNKNQNDHKCGEIIFKNELYSVYEYKK